MDGLMLSLCLPVCFVWRITISRTAKGAKGVLTATHFPCDFFILFSTTLYQKPQQHGYERCMSLEEMRENKRKEQEQSSRGHGYSKIPKKWISSSHVPF